jgi:Methyltransferase domain
MKQPPTDLSCFRWIESQTTDSDRQALLSIREAVCAIEPNYRYLEVGSHLGGSLQPHVIDPRCTNIFSIDPRPLEQPDERWTHNHKYEGNSTGQMLALLSKIPAANTSKIQTFETSSWEMSPASVPLPIDFAFIDGEHTDSAVFKDFIAVRRFLSPTAILAFHDCFVTPGAFPKISRTLRHERQPNEFLHFPASSLVALTFGSNRLNETLLQFGWRQGLPYSGWYTVKQHLRKRYPRLVSLVAWGKRCGRRKPDASR